MIFSSPVFLFLFLPLVLGGYYVFFRPAQRASGGSLVQLSNGLLLAASLAFYTWGEGFYVMLMLGSIAANYATGLLIEWARSRGMERIALSFGVMINLGLLASFKYTGFFVGNLNSILTACGGSPMRLDPVHLPIGISFFTFQAMSYLVDVYRREAEAQRNPLTVALYISLFPQLIAGPIVRYHDIASQFVRRTVDLEDFAYGARRFIIGLGKKVLIADTLALAADPIFAIPSSHLTPGLAWLGVACFSFQIYFDFSGYSDMAIGLGRMFGFRLLENFQWPYTAQSIRDFWRRWHISLSTWFRDYLYVPLGGNRSTARRTYLNLLIVFLLCGLWHGASWTFVVWGAYHGIFLVVERLGLGGVLARCWRPVRHLYSILVIGVGWVFFRSDGFAQALEFFRAMAGFGAGDGLEYAVGLYLDPRLAGTLAAAALGSIPWLPWLGAWRARVLKSTQSRSIRALDSVGAYASVAALISILVISAAFISASTSTPFIYFRF